MDVTTITPDPIALRAMSHPVRLRMLGLLRTEGPATATSLAQALGLNTGATSYHLRQLAQHGFVVDVPERGSGRERWWAAAHQSTRTSWTTDPDERDAQDAFSQAIAVVHTEELQRAIEDAALLPDPWRRASTHSDWAKRLTPERALALIEAVDAVLSDFEEDDDEPGAELFRVILHAFPRPGTVPVDPTDDPEDPSEDPS